MLRAHTLRPKGSFSNPSDSVILDHDGRHRRRIALKGMNGTRFLLDLPHTADLQDGDGLELEDGRVIVVRAAPESLMEVTAPDPLLLMRLLWHIGNRHLPADIRDDRVLIRPDHAIARMIEGLGGRVRNVEAPFLPEVGAYHHHGHHHGAEGGDAG